MHKWIVGIDPYSIDEQGWIIHRQAPEFIAKWTTEDEDTGVLSDLVYSDADEETALAIYDFEWRDEMPGEKLFRGLMDEGIRAIDEYLMSVAGLREEG